MILAALLFFFGKWFYGLYFDEPHIIEMGVMISRFTMVVVLLQISQVIYSGCLRAAGDVKYVLIAALISVTTIRTLVTVLLVLVFPMGLAGVWLGVLSLPADAAALPSGQVGGYEDMNLSDQASPLGQGLPIFSR